MLGGAYTHYRRAEPAGIGTAASSRRARLGSAVGAGETPRAVIVA